jgi:hypothetical protein
MLLDATTDSLEIILDKAVTTNQLSFSVYFNEYTSTTVTPTENTGITNNTTAVNLISSPSASTQRQLRWCCVNNVDTKDIGVKIRFNDNGSYRNVMYVFLRVGESIQYSEEMGWRVYDSYGSEKINAYYKLPGTIRMPEGFGSNSVSVTQALANTNAYCVYLGTAERAFSSIRLRYAITTILGATITWAELAIYKGTPTIGSGTTMTRMGFTDTSGVWNSIGSKTTTVTVSDMAIGDDLWAVFSTSSSNVTPMAVRAGAVDDIGTGFFQIVTNARPSTNSSIAGTISSTVFQIWVAWQGVPL